MDEMLNLDWNNILVNFMSIFSNIGNLKISWKAFWWMEALMSSLCVAFGKDESFFQSLFKNTFGSDWKRERWIALSITISLISKYLSIYLEIFVQDFFVRNLSDHNFFHKSVSSPISSQISFAKCLFGKGLEETDDGKSDTRRGEGGA